MEVERRRALVHRARGELGGVDKAEEVDLNVHIAHVDVLPDGGRERQLGELDGELARLRCNAGDAAASRC